MAHEIIVLLTQYGVLLVFLNVLVEQAGVPVPAVPTLVVAGALAANGQLPLASLVGAAVLACLIADGAWYLAGRRYGSRVLRTICRVSLSPDSCVKQSAARFERWRGRVLLVAKFLPGLSTVAPPLVGALGLRSGAFVLFDTLGSLLWVAVTVAAGYALAPQIDRVLLAISQAGTIALQTMGVLLAIYVLVKWWQRQRLIRALRMARISVEELQASYVGGNKPVVVDVRSALSRQMDDRIIPGAVLADLAGIDLAVHDVPVETELVLYCACPNEVSAATAAKALMAQGYRRVRPLLGGLDAWEAAGYPVERLPAAPVDMVPGKFPTQSAA
ncbi:MULTISPECIES: VTT domain-containing protein [Dyella]|uniref:Sulfurtransferase n=2 Tax=Dyella TaxID=231454 RepID=A0A4R0YPH0_9GAMM|nr:MULTISPECIES: VTT domain-containing protein [Dyella]TBR37005.1 sulfurtransferase [Dyella terrae]TCI07905.1 sulfurtransferase [Dyella soli]